MKRDGNRNDQIGNHIGFQPPLTNCGMCLKTFMRSGLKFMLILNINS